MKLCCSGLQRFARSSGPVAGDWMGFRVHVGFRGPSFQAALGEGI